MLTKRSFVLLAIFVAVSLSQECNVGGWRYPRGTPQNTNRCVGCSGPQNPVLSLATTVSAPRTLNFRPLFRLGDTAYWGADQGVGFYNETSGWVEYPYLWTNKAPSAFLLQNVLPGPGNSVFIADGSTISMQNNYAGPNWSVTLNYTSISFAHLSLTCDSSTLIVSQRGGPVSGIDVATGTVAWQNPLAGPNDAQGCPVFTIDEMATTMYFHQLTRNSFRTYNISTGAEISRWDDANLFACNSSSTAMGNRTFCLFAGAGLSSVYFVRNPGTNNVVLSLLDIASNQAIWNITQPTSRFATGLTVLADGSVVLSTSFNSQNYMQKVFANGSIAWSTTFAGDPPVSNSTCGRNINIVSDANGFVYFSNSTTIYCIDSSTGSVVWTWNHPFGKSTIPVALGYKALYLGDIVTSNFIATLEDVEDTPKMANLSLITPSDDSAPKYLEIHATGVYLGDLNATLGGVAPSLDNITGSIKCFYAKAKEPTIVSPTYVSLGRSSADAVPYPAYPFVINCPDPEDSTYVSISYTWRGKEYKSGSMKYVDEARHQKATDIAIGVTIGVILIFILVVGTAYGIRKRMSKNDPHEQLVEEKEDESHHHAEPLN